MSSIPADAGAAKDAVEQAAAPLAKPEETKFTVVEEIEDLEEDVPDPDEDDLDDLDGKFFRLDPARQERARLTARG